jgi:hypothetical protein
MMPKAIETLAIATVIAASASVAFAQILPAPPARPEYPAAPNSHSSPSYSSQYRIYFPHPAHAQCVRRSALRPTTVSPQRPKN